MALGTFSTLEDRLISLKTAADVVRLSFIVQKSISCLNLELNRNSRVSNYFETLCNCCGSSRLRNFVNVNSEEKCRKFFTPSRRLLYTLHLDLPKGREYSLMEDVSKSVRCLSLSSSPHIGKITPTFGFYSSILSNFIEEALKINTPKLKILKWILKFTFAKVPLFASLQTRTANKFINCFYPEITDSALFKDFILQFDILDWLTQNEDPEILEYLLYHARRLGRKDLEEPIENFLGACIYPCYFSNIGPVLKYINVPRFVSEDYLIYFYEIPLLRPSLAKEVVRDAAIWIKQERINHMLQIIWMHMVSCRNSCIEATSEALRLLWNSFPDAYISLEELKTVFGNVFPDKNLKNIYEFYARAVGEFHEYVEPRSLQHLCRFIIRRNLRENKNWIPDGISQTGLPKPLQSFVNLEKPCF